MLSALCMLPLPSKGVPPLQNSVCLDCSSLPSFSFHLLILFPLAKQDPSEALQGLGLPR